MCNASQTHDTLPILGRLGELDALGPDVTTSFRAGGEHRRSIVAIGRGRRSGKVRNGGDGRKG